MEKRKEACPDALGQCVTRAWEEAISQLAETRMRTPSVIESNGDDHWTSFPHPLRSLLKLEAVTKSRDGSYLPGVVTNGSR